MVEIAKSGWNTWSNKVRVTDSVGFWMMFLQIVRMLFGLSGQHGGQAPEHWRQQAAGLCVCTSPGLRSS